MEKPNSESWIPVESWRDLWSRSKDFRGLESLRHPTLPQFPLNAVLSPRRCDLIKGTLPPKLVLLFLSLPIPSFHDS